MAGIFDSIVRWPGVDPNLWSTPSRDASYEQFTPQMWNTLMQAAPQRDPSLWPQPPQPPDQPPADYDINERFMQRTRQSVKPEGGRKEGALSSYNLLTQGIPDTLAHINKLGQGFVGAAQDYSDQQFPQPDANGNYRPISTDDDPLKRAVETMDPLIANLWGIGSASVPTGAAGALGTKLLPKSDLVWSGLSKTKHIPEEMMSAKITPTNDLLPVKNVLPADLQNSVVMALPGDPTAAGGILTGVNSNWLSRAVPLEGGFNYMRSPAQQIDKSMWASTPGATSTMAGRVRDLAESGKDVYGAYSLMGPHSGDFSTMMSDALLGQLHVSDISKKGVAAFDADMRSMYKDWPGLNDPGLRSALNANGPMRKDFVKTAALAEHQEAGLPEIASARRAITEPELLHQPTGLSGHAIGKFDPTGRIVERPSVEHGTYAAPIAGTYEGRFEVPVPRDLLWRDWFAERGKIGQSVNVNDPKNQYAFGKQLVAQNMDQQAVDTLSKYIEARKAGTALFANATDKKTGAAVLAANNPDAIRAYHGSPHDFDRFDISKIGTGEGAQVYGRGLYFADREGVARSYRDALQKNTRPHSTFDDKRINPTLRKKLENDPDPAVARFFQENSNTSYYNLPHHLDEQIANVESQLGHYTRRAAEHRANPPVASTYSAEQFDEFAGGQARLLDRLRAIRSRAGFNEGGPTGKMYEVNINAKPEELLDWDRPLHGQPVADIVRSLVNPDLRKTFDYNVERGISGSNAYHNFYGSAGGHARAADILREGGIPGIKYSDAGSRLTHDTQQLVDKAGSRAAALDLAKRRVEEINNSNFNYGSRASHDRIYWENRVKDLQKDETNNYVMFDDKLIDIIRKYGLAGAVGGPLAPGLFGPSADQHP